MKKIKPVIQKDSKDCGVCSMQWIIMYYDGYLPLEKLREDTFTNINGTNAYHIVNCFKKWGFDAIGILEHDLNKECLKFPFIAHLTLPNGLEHFVVVKEIIKDTIYIMDPSVGNKKMNMEEFNKLFTGHIILAHPRSKIIKMTKGLTISKLFFNIIFKEKFLILKIIFTSLILTIISIISSYYLKVGSNMISSNYLLLKYLIGIFFLITILKISFLYIKEYYMNHLNNLVDVYLYPEFLKHIFYLPLKNIKSRSTGEVITRINELGNIKSLFTDILVSGFLDTLMMFISTIILYIINSKLFIILIIFICLYFIYGILISKIIYKKLLENINYQTDFNSLIVERVNGIVSLKNLNLVDENLFSIEKCLAKYLYNNYKFNSLFNVFNLGKDFLLEISFFLINSVGLWNVYKSNMNIIDLFTFNIILGYFIDPVQNIINLLPKYNFIKATFTKISEFINIKEEEIKKEKMELKGNILFKNVSFSYNNYDYVFKDINLEIKEGMHVLLNGESASGKSTICKLIYKENAVTNGEVLIDSINIKDLNINTLRENILYVSQDEELFTGSIKENILMNRNIDFKKFQDICKICEIESIVKKKNLRYDSLIEAGAMNLSGGEKQRIILARGLLKQANIIILDEALSEVDKKLETKIIKNIKKYFEDKTIIYISHKNQTRNFDNVINVGEL